jgi:uncharacterized membrane protein
MTLCINKWLLAIVFAVLSLSYPFILYFYPDAVNASFLLIGLMSLWVLRMVLPILAKNRALDKGQKVSLVYGLVIATIMIGISQLGDDGLALKLYPTFMSLSVAGAFGLSLRFPPSIIERMARLTDPNLDEAGVQYTRTVTKTWVWFCLVNAAVSVGTVMLQDARIWTLYNGIISYVLMGLMMGGEFIYRAHVKSKRKFGDVK